MTEQGRLPSRVTTVLKEASHEEVTRRRSVKPPPVRKQRDARVSSRGASVRQYRRFMEAPLKVMAKTEGHRLAFFTFQGPYALWHHRS
ncbi:hypothetical protein E2C01_033372 [Portunus trituberculatus]|uniref:Uncharacterized protein n=1 Tax=Portunus trituberculatus TaxID=210409 RepID=A0A5B7F413_PORTR|nr:hypothetical protein [Portunus trituberculatus]